MDGQALPRPRARHAPQKTAEPNVPTADHVGSHFERLIDSRCIMDWVVSCGVISISELFDSPELLSCLGQGKVTLKDAQGFLKPLNLRFTGCLFLSIGHGLGFALRF